MANQILTQPERDNLRRAIAESDITDGRLENADIDALVDLFDAWLERRNPAANKPAIPRRFRNPRTPTFLSDKRR